jgi:1-acyl-sn-glycerol-3-phosphate acyltransferase
MRRIPHTFFIKDEDELERYVFQTIAQWSKSVLKITKMKLDVRGAEHLKPDQTYLFVSNHRSPADIPVLFATIPRQAAFVANAIFQKIPAIAYWMRASGSVFIDQSNPKSALAAFKSMARRLRRGRSLILFPEGHYAPGEGHRYVQPRRDFFRSAHGNAYCPDLSQWYRQSHPSGELSHQSVQAGHSRDLRSHRDHKSWKGGKKRDRCDSPRYHCGEEVLLREKTPGLKKRQRTGRRENNYITFNNNIFHSAK